MAVNEISKDAKMKGFNLELAVQSV